MFTDAKPTTWLATKKDVENYTDFHAIQTLRVTKLVDLNLHSLNKMKILNKLVRISFKGKSIKHARFVDIFVSQCVNNYHFEVSYKIYLQISKPAPLAVGEIYQLLYFWCSLFIVVVVLVVLLLLLLLFSESP